MGMLTSKVRASRTAGKRNDRGLCVRQNLLCLLAFSSIVLGRQREGEAVSSRCIQGLYMCMHIAGRIHITGCICTPQAQNKLAAAD